MGGKDKLALLGFLMGAAGHDCSGHKRKREDEDQFVHPAEVLKKAKVPPSKARLDERLECWRAGWPR